MSDFRIASRYAKALFDKALEIKNPMLCDFVREEVHDVCLAYYGIYQQDKAACDNIQVQPIKQL